ncbi:MAG TPA: helix-turn-helix transcriptional regulator [Gaiellaceae bacterium]|nr:helix-turn-helix transcriptional regulator [Gaiellaceae bacterium]
MTKPVPSGHVDSLILAVLADGPCHGYAVIEELRDRSEGVLDFPEGTIYPALYKLEAAGAIASSWTVVDGRRRRMYRLTSAGRRRLARARDEWDAFARAMTVVLA